ncbi:glycine oxidase [Thiothrix eikelboomii]|uniref:Glycine oxidase n=1 Tax=Thiothrix eikelboomii TaxID=92487 RepID=A0A1T4XH02_9GAMM|nr:FAD-dependent oxidoreductase [Thiothrix eikelboomii]SKA88804.1 glycine oxidase [Thiothrix eikelboomii]
MKDVIIVGGGLKGMLTALFLHDAGLNIMLVDQNELGRESSWAGGGLITPLYPWQASPVVSALVKDSQKHYPALCERLYQETNIDPQWLNSGLLITDTSQHQAAQEWAKIWDYPLQILEGASLTQCEPQLNSQFGQALYFPQTAQVRSPRLNAAVRAALRMRPILVSQHQAVRQLHSVNGQIGGIYLGNDLFKAHKVILTAGAWTSAFAEVQASPLQLRPQLAESIMFRTSKRSLQRMIVHQQYYLIPRKDGRIVCGSVFSSQGLEKTLSEQAQQELRRVACELMPELAELPIHNHWSSLLSFSENDEPFMGEHPTIRGLYINAGHGSNGVATGLGSVRALMAQVLA